MPVSEPAAYALLHAHGMLEFTLKRTAGFLGADGDPTVKRAKAKVDWDAFDRKVAALPSDQFLDQLSATTRARMLDGPRNRPKVQFVVLEADGTWSPKYQVSDLPPNDALALVHAMRRVRNNLFHGGKEDPLDDPDNEDESWAVAATEIAQRLLTLLDRHVINGR